MMVIHFGALLAYLIARKKKLAPFPTQSDVREVHETWVLLTGLGSLAMDAYL
jgi:hypothetical protein